MKAISEWCIFLSFLLNFSHASAQTDFKPGYIITYADDTIQGLISYRGDSICYFKQKDHSEVKNFKPLHIAGFKFTGGKYYLSKEVFTNQIKSKLFLDLLVDGLIDLYCYNTGNHPKFFIQKSGTLVELIEKDYSYIETLKTTFSDCPRLFREINNLWFDSEPLMYLTKKYNRFVSSEKNVYIVKPPMVKLRLGTFVSISQSFMNYENSILYEAFDLKSTIFPSAGLLINTSFPRIMRILSFQVSGEIGKNHYYDFADNPYSSTIFEEVNLNMLIFKGKAGFKFIYPRGKLRPSLFFGGSVIHILNKDGRRLQDSFEDPVIYMEAHEENITAKDIYGYAIDLGFDYHHSKKFISFFSICTSLNTGQNNSNEIWLYRYDQVKAITTNNLTFSINAGFYF